MVLVLNTRGVFMAMTDFLFDRTVLLIHHFVEYVSMFIGTEDHIILRFDEGNTLKYIECHLVEIFLLFLFLTHWVEQDLLLGKEIRQELPPIITLADRALEWILGLSKPLLEARTVDRHTSLAVAAASLHQLTFF